MKPAVTHRVGSPSRGDDLSTDKGAKGTLTANLATDKGGSVDLAATFGVDPLALNAKIDARRIDLVALRPYVEQFATVA